MSKCCGQKESIMKHIEMVAKEVFPKPEPNPGKDMVNHPDHYKSNKYEVIDIIEAFNLTFGLGNTVKYILRAGKKDPSKTLEDYKKARWYLDREIKKLEEQNGT